MKYWRGYLAAAIFVAITIALNLFAKSHTVLVDMVYPYTSRLIQSTLADWSAGAPFCLWQVFAIVLVVVLLATVVAMIIFKWNFVQWLGWVLTGASMLWLLHTGVYGLNNYAGGLAEDIRLNVTKYNVTELIEATTYFRDQANELALQVQRNEDGSVSFPSFEDMSTQTGEGFKVLTYEKSYSVFAGSTAPVKKLGWANMYTSMGISGVSMPLTGEAAVNPNIPALSMPFTMCHEVAHRMCIASERDANFAGFLACINNPDINFQYSGYMMAFRYCYNALAAISTTTATSATQKITEGICAELAFDLEEYRTFLAENIDENASDFANSVNDTYIKASGDEQGVDAYADVCDLLVSWHIQEIYAPLHQDEEEGFNPLDKNQVDLSQPATED